MAILVSLGANEHNEHINSEMGSPAIPLQQGEHELKYEQAPSHSVFGCDLYELKLHIKFFIIWVKWLLVYGASATT